MRVYEPQVRERETARTCCTAMRYEEHARTHAPTQQLPSLIRLVSRRRETDGLQHARPQVLAVLRNFSALPVERLHNIIKFTVTEPRLTQPVADLEALCDWMLARGELVRDARGWLTLPRTDLTAGDAAVAAAPSPSPSPPPAAAAGNGVAAAAALNGAGASAAGKPQARARSPVPVAARVPTPRPVSTAYPPHLRDVSACSLPSTRFAQLSSALCSLSSVRTHARVPPHALARSPWTCAV